MPVIQQSRQINLDAHDVYQVVIDVAQYPIFLPYCQDVSLQERQNNYITADMEVGFKMLRQSYTSHIHHGKGKTPAQYHNKAFKKNLGKDDYWIHIATQDSDVFKHLRGDWRFIHLDYMNCI